MPVALPSQYVPFAEADISRGSRILANQFGSGYKQRIVDGANPDIETWNLSFHCQANTVQDPIAFRAFLKARAIDPVVWIPPDESVGRNYLVQQPFGEKFYGNGTYVFSVVFEWVPL